MLAPALSFDRINGFASKTYYMVWCYPQEMMPLTVWPNIWGIFWSKFLVRGRLLETNILISRKSILLLICKSLSVKWTSEHLHLDSITQDFRIPMGYRMLWILHQPRTYFIWAFTQVKIPFFVELWIHTVISMRFIKKYSWVRGWRVNGGIQINCYWRVGKVSKRGIRQQLEVVYRV
jgi:hypothetical protein